MAIVKRLVKGVALTHAELDNNFTELDTRLSADEATTADHETRVSLVEGSSPAAPAGARFVSDGAGSGEHIRIAGFGHYSDNRVTAGSPVQTLATGVRTKFLCNGLRLTREKLPSDAVNPLWNVTTNKITPIAEYDMHTVRLWFKAENYAGASPYIQIEIDVGGTDGVIFTHTFPLLKSGASQDVNIALPTYAGPDFSVNGGEVYLTYVGTGSVDIHSNSVVVNRESKNYV